MDTLPAEVFVKNQVHIFPFGTLELNPRYAIITCLDYVNIDFPEVAAIETVLADHYSDTKIALVANRENQYSVNPFAIDKLFSNPLLAGGAILGGSHAVMNNALIEAAIVKSAPIRFFMSMSEIVDWIDHLRPAINQPID